MNCKCDANCSCFCWQCHPCDLFPFIQSAQAIWSCVLRDAERGQTRRASGRSVQVRRVGVRRECRVSEVFDGLCHNQAEVAVKTIVQLCATKQRLRGGTVGGCHAGPISKQGMKENDTRAASEAQLPADAATRKKDDGDCSRVGACHLWLLTKCGRCWRARASTHAGVANVQLKGWRCWTSARSFIRLHSSNRHDHPATRDNTSRF